MSDTQWTRYQVFVQEAEGKPHMDYGSVHAPDPELALLNARDVFARRPECVSMWVVPAEVIYSATGEELQRLDRDEPADKQASPEPYCVFIKSRQAGTMTFAGHVTAGSPAEALEKARREYARGEYIGSQPALVWWVFPERLVVKSDLRDVDSYFTPARQKSFRLSNDFHTLTVMKKIKHSAGKGAE